MKPGHARVRQKAPRMLHQVSGSDNRIAALDDALIGGMSLDRIVRQGAVAAARASIGAREDRPGFGLGVNALERSFRENQHGGAGGDIPQAVAAGVAVTIGGVAFRRIAIGSWPSGLPFAHNICL